ncbi:hypothetical protein AUJ65_03990 [Candidatus Micrarchaeota archaeon CG1_02_51_15]|nr:MAG: hypothetical protein AUJ65_03990 [Candidatus Micrarchaeota archaeon CG1_02_51_15]
MHDVLIIGAGPAGITAAIYCARVKLHTLVLSKNLGGQAALSGAIENYSGYQMITGMELARKFHEHLHEFKEIEHHDAPEEVRSVEKSAKGFVVKTDVAEYETRAVIVCSGAKARELGVKGETEFRNRGVSYCAACDAPVFKNKRVAVIGGGNSALDASLQLSKHAKKVFVLTSNPKLEGDALLKQKVLANAGIEVVYGARTAAIRGSKFVEAIDYVVGSKGKTLALQGIFVEIGWVPATGFLDSAKKNGKGEITVNSACETGVAGLFAAGDCTDSPEKQIIVAAGMGATAALSAIKYLQRK